MENEPYKKLTTPSLGHSTYIISSFLAAAGGIGYGHGGVELTAPYRPLKQLSDRVNKETSEEIKNKILKEAEAKRERKRKSRK